MLRSGSRPAAFHARADAGLSPRAPLAALAKEKPGTAAAVLAGADSGLFGLHKDAAAGSAFRGATSAAPLGAGLPDDGGSERLGERSVRRGDSDRRGERSERLGDSSDRLGDVAAASLAEGSDLADVGAEDGAALRAAGGCFVGAKRAVAFAAAASLAVDRGSIHLAGGARAFT